MNLLAVSGSLREKSSNTAVLRAAALVAPESVLVTLYQCLNDLPHFNPDLDTEPGPPAVLTFRALVRAADAVIMCSPEYAHGVSGVLKNALDWLVSSGEFVNKPIALINASTRATHAYASLAETLRIMMAVIVPEASITLALSNPKLEAADMAGDPVIASQLRASIAAISQLIGSELRHRQ